MNTVTHTLIPAIIAGICARAYRKPEKRSEPLSSRDILIIGLFGAAPDLLNPHLSLDARYTRSLTKDTEKIVALPHRGVG